MTVSLATLAVGVVALLGADFGMPLWLQVTLYLWLLTVGLPTTLTVVMLAAVWGRFEPIYGFNGFAVGCVLIAPMVQVLVMRRVRRSTSGRVAGGPVGSLPHQRVGCPRERS